MPENAEKIQRYKRGENPNSQKNLKLFSKGVSGNPNGKPKGAVHRATVYEQILQLKTTIKTPSGEKKDVTLYEAIALGQAQSAMKGNTNAWKEIQDSIHGKLADKSEVDANVTQKVIVEFIDGSIE